MFKFICFFLVFQTLENSKEESLFSELNLEEMGGNPFPPFPLPPSPHP